MTLPPYIQVRPDGILLAVQLQPRAAKNEICGLHGNELRVRVTAPPVDEAANDALLRFLADTFDCPRSCIELMHGHTSRHKRIKLTGVSPETVIQAVSRSTSAR